VTQRQAQHDLAPHDDGATRVWQALRALVLAHDQRDALRDTLGLGRGTGRIKVLLRLTEGPLTLRDIAEFFTRPDKKMYGLAMYTQNKYDAMAMGARKAFSAMDNLAERDRWLRLPFVGCDGVPKTGQTWVRTGSLAATVVIPPTAGRAITMLHQALQNGLVPPERSLTTPESFPPIEQLSPKFL